MNPIDEFNAATHAPFEKILKSLKKCGVLKIEKEFEDVSGIRFRVTIEKIKP